MPSYTVVAPEQLVAVFEAVVRVFLVVLVLVLLFVVVFFTEVVCYDVDQQGKIGNLPSADCYFSRWVPCAHTVFVFVPDLVDVAGGSTTILIPY